MYLSLSYSSIMNIRCQILLWPLLLSYVTGIEEVVEYGPKPLQKNADDNNSVTSTNDAESPSDVASVSKFITEFHRQFEEPYFKDDNEDLENKQDSIPVVEAAPPPENTTVNSNETEAKSSNSSSPMVNCIYEKQTGILSVELVNTTRILTLLSTGANVTMKSTKAECVVLLFYSRTCPFSCMAAPHFNALPRAFPGIKMAAVNVLAYQSTNTQYGIVGVPTIILFHNGRPAAKFNESEYNLEMFTNFIAKYTGLAPEEKMFVTSSDFGGPVPSVVAKETDYLLALAWAVIATVGGVAIGKSRAWRALVETIQNTWRDAEAREYLNFSLHAHAD